MFLVRSRHLLQPSPTKSGMPPTSAKASAPATITNRVKVGLSHIFMNLQHSGFRVQYKGPRIDLKVI